jgi:hypothetical protein
LLATGSALAAAATVVLPPAHATGDATSARPTGVAQRIIERIPGPAVRARSAAPIPATANAVGPGTYLVIDRPDGSFLCSGGFVFSVGGQLMLGTAGHCFLPAGKVATHGPGADFDASGIAVSACVQSCFFGGQLGALNNLVPLGRVRYARQSSNGADVGHDFGIVEIPNNTPIRTSVPVWGGPTSSGASLGFGEPVCMYGNASGVAETFVTAARPGVGVFSDDEAWGADIPSVQGDSGAGVVTCTIDANGVHGQSAVGILTHLVAGGIDTTEGTTIAQAQRLAAEAGLSIGNPLAG